MNPEAGVFSPFSNKTMLTPILSLALAVLPGVSAQAHIIALPGGAALTLPKEKGVSVQWLMPPSPTEAPEIPVSFAVDPHGAAWLVREHQIVFIPAKNALFKSDRPFQQAAWLPAGANLIRSGEVLGVFAFGGKKSEKGLPEIHLKPLTTIALNPWVMAPAGRNSLYIAGYNPRKRLSQICLLAPAAQGKRLKVLFRTSAQISDVAGDGRVAYFASGPSIWKLTAKGAKLVYARRRGDIRRLIYAPGAGLFFATDKSVGFARDGDGFDFMQAPRPQIALAQGELYVMLGGLSQGVLRIGGLSRFAGVIRAWRRKD
ncbi:MAG: hypothetical protein KGI84_05005 [Elusimicrobia bacterium]|nr:hypothetical protein [Elusimicrobiota bacterium]